MLTLSSPHHHESEVKKSRFIANVARADTIDEALAVLEGVSLADANHNCWAYKIGDQYRFSDDGEPGGTAGRPILAAIEGQGLDHVVVVVTRYFGGIKLGAGGLVRAYGGAAAECLRTAQRIEILPSIDVEIALPFELTGAVHDLIDKQGLPKVDEQYDEHGAVLTVTVVESALEAFEAALGDATRGRAKIRRDPTNGTQPVEQE